MYAKDHEPFLERHLCFKATYVLVIPRGHYCFILSLGLIPIICICVEDSMLYSLSAHDSSVPHRLTFWDVKNHHLVSQHILQAHSFKSSLCAIFLGSVSASNGFVRLPWHTSWHPQCIAFRRLNPVPLELRVNILLKESPSILVAPRLSRASRHCLMCLLDAGNHQ